MARLVEECRHLREGHERGLAVDWRRAVAREVRHRLALERLRLADADAHPRAAALVLRPRVRVEVEGCDVLAGVVHLEELHLGLPHLHLARRLHNLHAEEALAQTEEARENVRQRKVRTERFLLKLEELLRLALGPVGGIPQRERITLEAFRLEEVVWCVRGCGV